MNWNGRCVALIAAVIPFFFCACGGGGGDGESSTSDQPASLAPETLAGQTLILSGASGREIAFESGNVWTENRDGSPVGGTYQYTPNGNSGEVTLVESGSTSTIRLAFSAINSGMYIAGAEQGTFQTQENRSEPADPGGDDGSPYGLAPATLEGRTMHGTRTFTTTGPVGQTHIYTFAGSTFHDSDPPEESDGAYTYAPAADRADLTLNYYSPKSFNGDLHELHLVFTGVESGTFQSVYTRRDGTVIRINGTFQIE